PGEGRALARHGHQGRARALRRGRRDEPNRHGPQGKSTRSARARALHSRRQERTLRHRRYGRCRGEEQRSRVVESVGRARNRGGAEEVTRVEAFLPQEVLLAALLAATVEMAFLGVVIASRDTLKIGAVQPPEPASIPIEVRPVLDDAPLLKLGGKKV